MDLTPDSVTLYGDALLSAKELFFKCAMCGERIRLRKVATSRELWADFHKRPDGKICANSMERITEEDLHKQSEIVPSWLVDGGVPY